MNRRAFLHRIAPIVVAPALALEALEQARGRSMVGWTRGLEPRVKGWISISVENSSWEENGVPCTLVLHNAEGFRQMVALWPGDSVNVPAPVTESPLLYHYVPLDGPIKAGRIFCNRVRIEPRPAAFAA